MVYWSEFLTTNHEVPGSIPGSTVGIFLEGEDSRGDHGLGRLVEFRFKAPPGTTSSSITTHTPSGQRNCASWASQPQQSVTLLPCPGGRTTKSTKGHVVALEEKKNISIRRRRTVYCKRDCRTAELCACVVTAVRGTGTYSTNTRTGTETNKPFTEPAVSTRYKF